MPASPESPSADPPVSVRPARPVDAPAIGRVQLAAWRQVHAAALGAAAATLDAAAFADGWREAIEHPPSPAHRVLVALDGATVIGFAALGAPARGVAELVALEMDPSHTRAGHGSRLLNAGADLAREDGASVLVAWVLEDDGARVGFLAGAGLAPDGVSRTLDVAGRPVREDRWSATL